MMLGRHSFSGGGSRPLAIRSLGEGGSRPTRRSFIRAGAGLATIIAAGKAPAAFIRSMIAARNALLGGAKSKGYIADGLLFSISPKNPYFDGTQYITTENDSFRTAFFNDFTIEFDICAESKGAGYGVLDGCIYYCGSYGNSTSLYNRDGVFLRWLINSVSSSDNALYEIQGDSVADSIIKWETRASLSFVHSALNNQIRVYKDGSLLKTISRYVGWNDGPPPDDILYIMGAPSSLTNFGCTKGYLYNIRMYTRQLADDEIVENCAIDKARFNLPA